MFSWDRICELIEIYSHSDRVNIPLTVALHLEILGMRTFEVKDR